MLYQLLDDDSACATGEDNDTRRDVIDSEIVVFICLAYEIKRMSSMVFGYVTRGNSCTVAELQV